jgi:hypothetical protein
VRASLVALLVLLVLAACGGEDGAEVAETQATETTSRVETVAAPLEGADAFAVCGGETEFIPQFAATIAFDSVWVACRTDGEVLRIDSESGAVLARVPADGAVMVTADDSSVWAVWREGGTVYRIDPETNEVAGEVALSGDVPYIWARGGFLWAAPGGGTEILRIDPETMEVSGSVQVGDGTSDMVGTATRCSSSATAITRSGASIRPRTPPSSSHSSPATRRRGSSSRKAPSG